MLFMAVINWEPENRDEVYKRRIATGTMESERFKVLGQWIVFGGGKAFWLFDVDDQKDGYEAMASYDDICKIEILPVGETKEAEKWGKELRKRA